MPPSNPFLVHEALLLEQVLVQALNIGQGLNANIHETILLTTIVYESDRAVGQSLGVERSGRGSSPAVRLVLCHRSHEAAE